MSHDALIEALSGSIVCQDGVIVYLNAEGRPHRTDGPAIVYPDGNLRWCRNGVYHRADGPAVIYPNGLRAWYLYGVAMVEDEHNQRIKSGEFNDTRCTD